MMQDLIPQLDTRILHIDFGLEWRGGQRQVLSLHQGLLEHNIPSYLVCFRGSKLAEKCAQQNLDQVITIEPQSFGLKHSLLKVAAAVKAQIVHFHDAKSLNFCRAFRHLCLVETRRVSYPIKFFSRLWKYQPVNLHVGVSEEIASYLKQYFANVIAIHSCIDLSRFSQNSLQPQTNKRRLLFVGAMTKQKGIPCLIEAMHLLGSSYADVTLDLVGDGKLRHEIEEQVRQWNLQDRITFHGARLDVESFYQEASFVVVPSTDGEGSNGVIKEALAAGKAVIASDLSANYELMTDKIHGLFFKKGDAHSLKACLEAALSGHSAFDRSAILARAKDFSRERMVESYIKAYAKLPLSPK